MRCLGLIALWGVAASLCAQQTSGFKITYGTENRRHGAVWNGGVDDASRVRRILGWHLHDDDRLAPPARWQISMRSVGGDVAAPGIVLDLAGPETAAMSVRTRRGDIVFRPAEIAYGRIAKSFGIGIERVPLPHTVTTAEFEDSQPALMRTRSGEYWLAWIAYKTRRRDGYFYAGADEVRIAHSPDGRRWSRAQSITPPGDHFRVALGEDSQGRIWCVYGLQTELGSGNFDLYAKSFAGGNWSDAVRLTDDPRPDAFHRLAGNAAGALALVWVGWRENPAGGMPQSDIFLRRLEDGEWGGAVNLTASPDDDWEPSVAVDSAGRAWVAWDSYGADGYDVFARRADQSSPITVAATPLAEMRARIAIDGSGDPWLAWEEGTVNWGKDTGYENPRHRIHLKKNGSRLYDRRGGGAPRRPRIATLRNGKLLQPAQPVEQSAPDFLDAGLFQSPQIAIDAGGNAWVILRHQWRASGRYGGHFFDFYATSWIDGAWVSPILLTGSTGRQDTVASFAPHHSGGLLAAVVGDGRRMPAGLPKHHDISVLTIDPQHLPASARGGREPDWVPFESPAPQNYRPTHPREKDDLERIRRYRARIGGRDWKIVRGDLHRHTEISMDGATDGSLFDAYRYALNAAELDFLGVSDHNYGQSLDTDEPEDAQSDSEFQWWRSQKAADLFYVPGRFTPLYGYERTPNFPLGHRNIFHAKRGVFSLRVPKLHVWERPELLDRDPQNLWAYLRATGGIGIPHTPATTMGTDWKRRDDEVIPVTEIYQGDRNSYETQGGPRAALPDDPGLGSAGLMPYQQGLVQNALGVGYRMGFIASSDHYSTHISYANLIVPDETTTREHLLDAFRRRRTYASTDNIVLDFSAGTAHQGGELAAAQAPEFSIRVEGTAPLRSVEVIKNNRVVLTREGAGGGKLSFAYRDMEASGNAAVGPTATITDWSRPETGIRPRPEAAGNYYYVRVIQSYSEAEPEKDGEVAWSSPIWVRQE